MALIISELFGYAPLDKSPEAKLHRRKRTCPFLGAKCTKFFRDRERSGVCTVTLPNSPDVICCPNRLYANEYAVLHESAVAFFGEDYPLMHPRKAVSIPKGQPVVAVFGKRWGGELRLPNRRRGSGRGSYFVDWILALINEHGQLQDFFAVEVQSIDTTGSYREQRDALLRGRSTPGTKKSSLNWENVSKRILPQLIYKGHVLRRERKCTKGMVFVCPTAVYERILERLGGKLLNYAPGPGTLTFRWYDLSSEVSAGKHRQVVLSGTATTTVDQVALAFTSPSNLPDAGVYQSAIESEIRRAQGRD